MEESKELLPGWAENVKITRNKKTYAQAQEVHQREGVVHQWADEVHQQEGVVRQRVVEGQHAFEWARGQVRQFSLLVVL